MNRQFVVSGRIFGQVPPKHVVQFVGLSYKLPLSTIRSIFGFAEDHSPLYGGRAFSRKIAVPYESVENLNSAGIGWDLTLTNSYFDEDNYTRSRPILDRLYNPLNGVICTNHDLARRLRDDYPDYTLRLSCIVDYRELEPIEKALQLYDYVTLHADLNSRPDFIRSLPHKERIILFANSACSYFCRFKTCYERMAEKNRGIDSGRQGCARPTEKKGDYIEFDLDDPLFEGFQIFKLVKPAKQVSILAA